KRSERVVGTVAERLALGRLAAAEPHFLGLFRGVKHRREAGPLVRAVTERLLAASPASAPEIALSLFDGDVVRRLLRRDRLLHLSSLPSPLLLFTRIVGARRDFRRGPRAAQAGARAGYTQPPGVRSGEASGRQRDSRNGGLYRNRRRRTARVRRALR